MPPLGTRPATAAGRRLEGSSAKKRRQLRAIPGSGRPGADQETASPSRNGGGLRDPGLHEGARRRLRRLPRRGGRSGARVPAAIWRARRPRPSTRTCVCPPPACGDTRGCGPGAGRGGDPSARGRPSPDLLGVIGRRGTRTRRVLEAEAVDEADVAHEGEGGLEVGVGLPGKATIRSVVSAMSGRAARSPSASRRTASAP